MSDLLRVLVLVAAQAFLLARWLAQWAVFACCWSARFVLDLVAAFRVVRAQRARCPVRLRREG